MGSTTGPLVFTGVSSFSNDFQTILSRQQQLEQIPITALKNRQSDLMQKKQLLITMNPVVSNLASSIAALGSLGANQGLSATSSDDTLVSATNTGAISPASYSITQITSLASPASETSVNPYASSASTPISTAGANTLQLVYGSTTKTITLTSATNNLVGVRNAINNLGIGVTASILTTASGTNYLSVAANTTGQTTLQLEDIPSDGSGNPNFNGTPVQLLTSAHQGSNASFRLNGLPVTRTTNTINDVIPGLTFTLLGKTDATQPDQTVTLSLATDRTQLSSAITTFVQNYNALVDNLDTEVGPGAGLLGGDTLITTLQQDMWQLATYQGPGGIKNLSDLGVMFDTSGKLSFDPTGASTASQNGVVVFNSLSDSQISDAFKFFGSSTSGFGQLASQFTQLSDPVTGSILAQENGYDTENTALTDQINILTTRASAQDATLSAKLQAADALVAELQSEQNMLNQSIESLNFTAFGYQNTNTTSFAPSSNGG